MWKLSFNFFIGIFASAMVTNAIAVYLFHDVDADRIGKWNLAYSELAQEFFFFSLISAVVFLLITSIGRSVFGLRDSPNLKLGFVLGIAVIVIQYLAEFAVRKLTAGYWSEVFLLAYLLLSPICCAVVILLNSHKGRHAN